MIGKRRIFSIIRYWFVNGFRSCQPTKRPEFTLAPRGQTNHVEGNGLRTRSLDLSALPDDLTARNFVL